MRANQKEDHWELKKVFVKYIQENEEWLIADRLERSYQQEERQKMWEKEERMKMMSKRNETKRKIKTKISTGEEKDEKMHLKDGKYQMDGIGRRR